MSFMQPEIYCGEYWEVESPNGSTFFPVEVVGNLGLNVGDSISYRFPTEQEKRESGATQPENPFTIYVESPVVYSATLCDGVLGRLSAQGYMDCTNWSPYDSEEEAEEGLAEECADESDE